MKPAPPVTRIFISNALHEFVHRVLLLLDGLNQFKLRPAAVEVVTVAMHLEIRVALQIIRQEAQADLPEKARNFFSAGVRNSPAELR